MNLMYSCKKVAELLLLAQDEPLSLTQRAKLKLHLYRCANCTNFSEQLQSIGALVDDDTLFDQIDGVDNPASAQ